MKKDVLGIKIDDISIYEATKVVEKWLSNHDKHYIVTPNPEIVVMAQKDKVLKDIINQADLAVPDGIGLKFSGDIVNYSPGVDLMEQLILMAEEKGFTVGLLGGREKVAEKCAKRLLEKYPKLKINFAKSGGEIDNVGNTLDLTSDIRHLKSDLLFIAFGPPKQEKWITKNLAHISVKVAMGVGGAFDYLSGSIPRAPRWIRSIGLEWMFRLIVQPWRLKRQLTLFKYIWLLTKRRLGMLS